MRYLYTILLYLITPLVLLRLLRRGVKNRGYWQRWGERFGFFVAPALQQPIWIHAVSVGEVQAAQPLVRELQQRYPNRSIVVTTTTPTGSNRVSELFGDAVFHVYLPYDLPGAVRRFLSKVRPEVVLIMETEIWPNLYHACVEHNIPVVIANARLSPRSAAGYRRVMRLVRETLNNTAIIAAQGERDARRFQELGAELQRVRLMGSIKFDQRMPASIQEQAAVLRQQWGVNRTVLIAASTHEGEDEQILEAFETIRERHKNALLVLVPRHPERFDKVAVLCQRRGFSVVRRTERRPCDAETAVFVGDTLGELALFYAASDIAFVAGSLVTSVGGHNMLEPAALGLPVIVGPHLFNFAEISEAMLEAGAMRIVADVAELARLVSEWMGDAALRTEIGERGRQLVEDNRGALQKLLVLAEPYLKTDQ